MRRAGYAYCLRFAGFALALLLLGWLAHQIWFYNLPSKPLHAAEFPIQAKIASTAQSRRWGLMFRLGLEQNQGMLLAFPQPQRVCLWMQYTFLPLSVAFIRADGLIAGFSNMAPLTGTPHCSPQPVSYALEVHRGWYDARKLPTGARVTGL